MSSNADKGAATIAWNFGDGSCGAWRRQRPPSAPDGVLPCLHVEREASAFEAADSMIETPAVEIVRAHGKARTHGVETRRIEGVPVRLTSPAKTVADCFRYRRHVGLETAIAALRDYIAKKAGTVDALVAAARADRAYSIVRPYLEALV